MPSIPQSLLWISLVVLWLFVLVPMLINKRDTVRRTSDVALSTRVLNGGMRSRLRRRPGPAAGHRHDPLWSGDGSDLDQDYDDYEAEDYEEAVREAVQEAEILKAEGYTGAGYTGEGRVHTRTMMVVASVTETIAEANTEPVYLDVDVVDEDSGALPVGGGVQESLFDAAAPSESEPPAEAVEVQDQVDPDQVDHAPTPKPEPVVDEAAPDAVREPAGALGDAYEDTDAYEYVEDTSGLEAEEDSPTVAPPVSRRRRLESNATAAAVSARKFRFRKRVLMAMSAVMVLTAVLSFTVSSDLWWACGATATVTVLYLAYLRRQTRIEEQVRRRRQQRAARSRRYAEDGETFDDRRPGRESADVTGDIGARLRRPGAVVLDIDDEDPVFEHLDEVRYSRRYDLPRAAGQ